MVYDVTDVTRFGRNGIPAGRPLLGTLRKPDVTMIAIPEGSHARPWPAPSRLKSQACRCQLRSLRYLGSHSEPPVLHPRSPFPSSSIRFMRIRNSSSLTDTRFASVAMPRSHPRLKWVICFGNAKSCKRFEVGK